MRFTYSSERNEPMVSTGPTFRTIVAARDPIACGERY